jgi:hypothetical protein
VAATVTEFLHRQASATSIAPLFSILRTVPLVGAIPTTKFAIRNVVRKLLSTVSTLGGITAVLVGMISFSLPLDSAVIAYPETISFASFVVVLLWEIGKALHLPTPFTLAHDRLSEQADYSSSTIFATILSLLNLRGRHLKLVPAPLTCLCRFLLYTIRSE